MKIFDLFLKAAPNKVFISIVIGALSGVSYSLLIPVLLNVLRPVDARFTETPVEAKQWFLVEVANPKLAITFLIACVVVLVLRTFSQVMLVQVATKVAAQLRLRLYDQILAAPIQAIERIGPAKLLAVLTSDVPALVNGARMFPDFFINIFSLLGMMVFLYFLNVEIFWFVIGCITFGVITYQIPMIFGRRYIKRSRNYIDSLQEGIQGLLGGFKELKLSETKRKLFTDVILKENEERLMEHSIQGHTLMRIAGNYANSLSFFIIGGVAFILVNYHTISTHDLIGVIMVLLYVSAPISTLLNLIPQYVTAQVSSRKVAKVLQTIPLERSAPASQASIEPWETIRFNQVGFDYADNGSQNGFSLGPIDLEFKRGEINFIVGGNGSGKSTLSKLMALHYNAKSGSVSFGDNVVSEQNVQALRQEIGAVFSDYHLFDQLLSNHDEETWQQVNEYLEAFDLKKRLTFENGRFSTLALSDGQRRRLALLVTLLEDKSLYLFDEWAADQDPTFKSIFYYDILNRLKDQGKVVVVISHDEKYFDAADKLIEIEEGKVRAVRDLSSERKLAASA